MTLYDPSRAPHVHPADAVRVVEDFLERCRAWAVDVEIPKRLKRVEDSHDLGEAAKLHQWVTWERFVDHALRELRDGTLDPWFAPPVGPDPGAPAPDESDPARYSPGEETR